MQLAAGPSLPVSPAFELAPEPSRILPMPMVRKAKGGKASTAASSAPLSCPLSGSYLREWESKERCWEAEEGNEWDQGAEMLESWEVGGGAKGRRY